MSNLVQLVVEQRPMGDQLRGGHFRNRLALLVHDESDYSELSPIEPSATGGMKIAKRIAWTRWQQQNSHLDDEIVEELPEATE